MKDHKEYSILVVEDEKPLQKAIKAKLERDDLNVLLAVDVDQAISYMEDKDVEVDAVWLDHYLFGRKDGLDFLAIVKEKGLIKDIPVFVVTNTGGHDKRHTYMSLGATEYYVKSNNRLDQIVADVKEKILEIK
jgi:DNA-binding NtrC family response regulator